MNSNGSCWAKLPVDKSKQVFSISLRNFKFEILFIKFSPSFLGFMKIHLKSRKEELQYMLNRVGFRVSIHGIEIPFNRNSKLPSDS